jgi:hypothetical protein
MNRTAQGLHYPSLKPFLTLRELILCQWHCTELKFEYLNVSEDEFQTVLEYNRALAGSPDELSQSTKLVRLSLYNISKHGDSYNTKPNTTSSK